MVNSPEFKAFCPSLVDQQTVQKYLEAEKTSKTEVPTLWNSVKHMVNQSDLDNSKKEAVKVLKKRIITQVKSELAQKKS